MQTIKKIFVFFFIFSTSMLVCQPPVGNNAPAEVNYSQGGLPWVTNFEEAMKMGKEANKPILILFTGTTWCDACRILESKVLNNPKFIADISQKFVFLKIEFTRSPSTSPLKVIADRYGVKVYPTIVVVNPEGNRLFVVNYKQDRAEEYAQELLGKLQARNKNNESKEATSSTASLSSIKNTDYKKDPKMDNEGYYIP